MTRHGPRIAIIAVLTAAACVVLGCGKAAMKEASMAFDLEDVEPLLYRLAGAFTGGFDSTMVTPAYRHIAALPVDSTAVLDLPGNV